MAVAVDAKKERALSDAGRFAPAGESLHGAGGHFPAPWDGDRAPGSFLVDLTAPEREDQAITGFEHILPIQGNELGAAEGAREADEQQRPGFDKYWNENVR